MEKAFLVSVRFRLNKYRDSWPIEQSAAELKELVRSSGVPIVGQISFEKEAPMPGLLIGKGQAEQVRDQLKQAGANLVVVGEDLSFSQQQNLEDAIGYIKVIDRTQLILDIFAQRAHSREGKVQVELAQLEYLLPRLVGKGIMLSRLGGGVGTRGPGEQKLEMDRRRIRAKIDRLKLELKEISRERQLIRKKRQENHLPAAALIGYTNAGKSSLLNALTTAEAPAGDRLFMTLDPLTRRMELSHHQSILMTDTVGFIHRLPHHLVESFKATLEEAVASPMLLHTLDASDPLMEDKKAATEETLEQLGAAHKKILLVFTKIDRLTNEQKTGLTYRYPEALFVSAVSREGLDGLKDRIWSGFTDLYQPVELILDGSKLFWLQRIYDEGWVTERQNIPEGVRLQGYVPHKLFGQLKKEGLISTLDK
jgi:GTP-binding protein HflX